MERWRQEHPDEAEPAAAGPEPGAAEAPKPTEPEAGKQPEAPKPGEQPPAAATPLAIDEWTSKDPAFKAALEANPALKGELMELARSHEAARPVLALLPNVEEAKFAIDNANQFLGLQHKFALAAEVPAAGDEAFQEFANLFQVVDEKGEPVRDAAGNPQMTESWDFLTRRINDGALAAADADWKTRATELRARLGFREGMTDDERAALEQRLSQADRDALEQADYAYAAVHYVAELMKRDDETLKLPELPADATPQQRELQERLKKDVESHNQKTAAGKVEARRAARQALETRVNRAYGEAVGGYIDQFVKEARERGEFIPDVILNQRWIDPKTGQETKMRDFGMRMFLQLDQKIKSFPTLRRKMAELEAAGAPAEQARVAFLQAQATKFLPTIVRGYIDEIQNGVRQMAAKGQEREAALKKVAREEPSTVGTPSGGRGPLSNEDVEAQALANLAKNPEYQRASRQDQFEMLVLEKTRIRTGAAA